MRTTNRSRMSKPLQHSIAVVLLIGFARAQELTELQAQTPAEFDDYLQVEAVTEPAQRVKYATAFLQRWPETALAAPVGIWLMESHRELNQGDDAIRAGERVIELNRDSVPALITLSELLVNLRTRAPDLARAHELARRVLKLVDGGIEVPRHVPLEHWLRSKRDYEARAWSVVGHAEFKRGRVPEALTAFARAIQAEPAFDGARHLRYGLLLQAAGRRAEANGEFAAVLRQGPEALRERARAALRAAP